MVSHLYINVGRMYIEINVSRNVNLENMKKSLRFIFITILNEEEN